MEQSLSIEQFLVRSRRLPFNSREVIVGAMRSQYGICRLIELRQKYRGETMDTFIIFRTIILHSDGTVSVLPSHIRERITNCDDIMTEGEMLKTLGQTIVITRPLEKPLELITEAWPALKAA